MCSHIHVVFCFFFWFVKWSSVTANEADKIWAVTWDFQQCGMWDQQSFRSACAYAQSDQSLCWSLEYSMSVKLLTEHHLEFLSLTGGCTGSSESTLVKMPHCWKSHVMAHLFRACEPESSSTTRVLSSAHCTGVRLYTLRIKIGTRTTSSHEHSRCWTCLRFGLP